MLTARPVEIDSLIGHRAAETGPCRFVILCQPRTGSSLLNTSLRQHPHIHMHREILNHRQPHRLPQDGYQRLRTALAASHRRAVGCNLHAFQPDRRWDGWPKWEAAWRALADDRDIKVVHLQRLDTIAQLASWKIAALLGRWGNQHDIPERPTIRIDPEELRWFRDWNRAVFEWRLSRLEHHDILPLTYESLSENWDAVIRQIQDFVGARPLPLPQAVRKNETRPLSEVVENYGELQDLPRR